MSIEQSRSASDEKTMVRKNTGKAREWEYGLSLQPIVMEQWAVTCISEFNRPKGKVRS